MDKDFFNKFAYFTGKQLQAFLNKSHSEVILTRLNKEKKIIKIEKGKYTFHEDDLIYATVIVTPSYLSGLSALNYYGFTTQNPIRHSIITTIQKKSLEKLDFVKVKKEYFFGFDRINYKNFDLFIAKPEKLFQNLGVSISDLEELLKSKLDKMLIIDYLKKIGNLSLIKRIGYLLEKEGIDIYEQFKKELRKDRNYIKLNITLDKTQIRLTKWRILVNN